VDVVYSNQLVEHLHPDDLVQQLGSVRSVLRPDGTYLCVTPNRLNGPHDISKYFDDEATGLHIKEYTNAELKALFLAAGFSDCCAYAGAEGRYLRLPVSLPIAIETILQRLPISIRKSIARRPPFTSLLGVVDRRTRLNPNGRAVLSHNPPSPGSEVGREAHGPCAPLRAALYGDPRPG
jgi:SAM-dependent methyltransferase